MRENISAGRDRINVKGRSRHVVGYLKDFLFSPDRIDTPVKVLSGGERNRLLLAKLFTRSANMMVMDEPTNDLDADTLELLEDLLAAYEGTLLLVSHDRAFLDNVVTSIIAFEGGGKVEEYVGGYEDWLRQCRHCDDLHAIVKGKADATDNDLSKVDNRSTRKQKLSYKEKTQLESLPAQIDQLEQEQKILEQQVSQSDFYQQDKETIVETMARIELIREDLQRAYDRWEYLDGIVIERGVS